MVVVVVVVFGGCGKLEEEMMVGWLECTIWVELVVDFGEEEEDEVLGYVEIRGKKREIGDGGSGRGKWGVGRCSGGG